MSPTTKGSTAMTTSFPERIRRMNRVFELPVNNYPVPVDPERLEDFGDILKEEMREIEDITDLIQHNQADIDILVAYADWLADLVVFIRSEATKQGIPLEEVLDIVMDSQDSKLVGGKAIKDGRGKFLKGPDYQPPEARIKELLTRKIEEGTYDLRFPPTPIAESNGVKEHMQEIDRQIVEAMSMPSLEKSAKELAKEIDCQIKEALNIPIELPPNVEKVFVYRYVVLEDGCLGFLHYYNPKEDRIHGFFCNPKEYKGSLSTQWMLDGANCVFDDLNIVDRIYPEDILESVPQHFIDTMLTHISTDPQGSHVIAGEVEPIRQRNT